MKTKKLKTIGDKTIGKVASTVPGELSPELYVDMLRVILDQKMLVDDILRSGNDATPTQIMSARNAMGSYEALISRWRLRIR